MTGQHASTPYDTIGTTYAQTRQPDPRIGAAIRAAIGGARSVVNVGAGTGSYEPPETVLAVEPSRVMIAQRPPGLAPAVITTAERIPLPDKSVDAALCILTIHHWPDLAAGIGELRRVASRGVFFTWDRDVSAVFWLLREYFPEMGAADYQKAVPLGRLVDLVGPASITPVRVPHDCVDGFLGAFWRRPAAYLDPVVRAGISGFTLAPPDELSRGLAGLEADLGSGVWRHRHQELLAMETADLGYRLVVAEWGERPS
ncbi:MAG: class I SAM-dependent methyltransferase [Dehalococcoidia bacterium]|nr:class I SAM-dependent methyltransferase [Dehalococcoidia bacterium]